MSVALTEATHYFKYIGLTEDTYYFKSNNGLLLKNYTINVTHYHAKAVIEVNNAEMGKTSISLVAAI
jgi:hypothetical protein